MTSGKWLRKALGLQNFPNARICRVADVTLRTYFVFVDSKSPYMPISRQRLATWFPSFGSFRIAMEPKEYSPNGRQPLTPLMDLNDFNGLLNVSQFIVVDIAGKYGDQSLYVTESVTTLSKERARLDEFIKLSDFKGFGMSAFTQQFRKERNKLGQTESRTAKLIQVDFTGSGSVIFSWLTEMTNKYGDEYVPNEVIPEPRSDDDFSLVPDPSKTYTLQIEILDFEKWLDTYPDKTEVTSKDMEDIFDVSNIKLWSSSPSFHWQSPNYTLSRLDGSIRPTDIAPKVWNQPRLHGENNAFVDKHLGGLLQNIQFWYGPMAMMLTKKCREKGLLP